MIHICPQQILCIAHKILINALKSASSMPQDIIFYLQTFSLSAGTYPFILSFSVKAYILKGIRIVYILKQPVSVSR